LRNDLWGDVKERRVVERVGQDEKMQVRKFAVKGNGKKRIGESEKELRENF
jgi:hypothetical protein